LFLILWDQPFMKKHRFFQLFNSVLMAVIAGVLTNYILQNFYSDWALGGSHLVMIPVFQSAEGSRYFCKSFYEHPCSTSGKNHATANACGCPSRPASFAGHPTRGAQHHSRNDSTRFRKACIFTTQKDAS
jgi:hypothetical protein